MPQLDPVICFFVLGVLAGVARAALRLPGAICEFVSTALRERYYDQYAMILFMQDVGVLRPGRF